MLQFKLKKRKNKTIEWFFRAGLSFTYRYIVVRNYLWEHFVKANCEIVYQKIITIRTYYIYIEFLFNIIMNSKLCKFDLTITSIYRIIHSCRQSGNAATVSFLSAPTTNNKQSKFFFGCKGVAHLETNERIHEILNSKKWTQRQQQAQLYIPEEHITVTQMSSSIQCCSRTITTHLSWKLCLHLGAYYCVCVCV